MESTPERMGPTADQPGDSGTGADAAEPVMDERETRFRQDTGSAD